MQALSKQCFRVFLCKEIHLFFSHKHNIFPYGSIEYLIEDMNIANENDNDIFKITHN